MRTRFAINGAGRSQDREAQAWNGSERDLRAGARAKPARAAKRL